MTPSPALRAASLLFSFPVLIARWMATGRCLRRLQAVRYPCGLILQTKSSPYNYHKKKGMNSYAGKRYSARDDYYV